MNIASLLVRAAGARPKGAAIAHGRGVVLNHAALAARAAAIGSYLTGTLGLQPGDRVALVMKNVPEYVEVIFGCWWAGLAAVPVNAKLHAREFAFILAHSGARVCFVTGDHSGTIGGISGDAVPDLRAVVEIDAADYAGATAGDPMPMAQVVEDDLAWLFYTSGTTGRPKGAMLSHRNLWAMTLSYFTDIDRIAPGDSILHAAPMSHGSGLYMLPHMAAMACQVVPQSGGFDVAEIVELLGVHEGVTMFAAPTMVNRIVAAWPDGGGENLKTIVYGGAPMHVADIKRALDVLGPRLAQLYGQGESPMCITGLAKHYYADRTRPCWEELIGSAGFPQTVVQVSITDEDGRELPAGETGEICVRGLPVMTGYWRNPEATRETLRGGWLHTGDVGVFHEAGFLMLMDRSTDMIISGGSNIYPREIEEVLLAHDGVMEAAVVGRPHTDWGEEVVAFVVLKARHRNDDAVPVEQELDELCRANIARFKRPRVYRFVNTLPKNNYGKILKRELRALLVDET